MGVTQKEIKFIISMRNDADAGIKAFNADLNMMKKAFQDLERSLGTKAADTKLTRSVESLNKFVSKLNEVSKSDAFKGFDQVSKAMERIGSGAAANATASMESFSKAIVKAAEAGIRLGSSQTNIQNLANGLAPFVTLMDKISGTAGNKLSKVATIISEINVSQKGEGPVKGLTAFLDKMDTGSAQIVASGTAVVNICKAINGLNAENLSKLSGMRIGGVGGGGGGTGGGGTGAVYQQKNWGPFPEGMTEGNYSQIYSLFQKSAMNFGSSGARGTGSGTSQAAIIGAIANAKRITESEGTPGVFHPSALAKMMSGQEWAEGIPGTSHSMGTIRGTAVHEAQKHLIDQVKAQHDVGKWIAEGGYKTQEWLDNVALEAERAEAAFIKLGSIVYTEMIQKKMPLPPNYIKNLYEAAGHVRQSVTKLGGKQGLFNAIDTRVSGFAGSEGRSEALGGMQLHAEKGFGALQIYEPGFKMSKELAAGPKGLQLESLKFVRESLLYLKQQLGKDSQEYKELIAYIKQFGFSIRGTADVVTEYSGIMKGMMDVWDIKTGQFDVSKLRYLATQMKSYRLGLSKELGTDIGKTGAYAFYPTGGGTKDVGPGTVLPEIVDKQIAKKQELVKETEKQIQTEETLEQIEIRRTAENDAAINKNIAGTKAATKALEEQVAASGGGMGGMGGGVSGGGGGFFVQRTAEMSRFNQVITETYLKQTMLGQKIDLTSVRISEHINAINSLSSAYSKYISVSSASVEGTIKSAAGQEKLITGIERTVTELNKYSKSWERIPSLQAQVLEQQERIRIGLQKKMTEPNQAWIGREITTAGAKTGAQMADWLRGTGRPADLVKEFSAPLKKIDELTLSAETARQGFEKFEIAMVASVRGEASSNVELNKLTATMAQLSPEFASARANVTTFDQAMKLFTVTQGQLIEKFQLEEISLKKVSAVVSELDTRFALTGVDTNNFNQSISKLNLGSMVLKDNVASLAPLQSTLSDQMLRQLNVMASLERQGKRNSVEYEKAAMTLKEVRAAFEVVGAASEKFGTEQEKVGMIVQRNAQRTSEHTRGSIRTSITGFTDMMRSQAAWIAGYGVMFGTLNAIKGALGSVLEMEHQYARAMRAANSEAMTRTQIFQKFTSEGTAAMIRFGRPVKDIGEVLYQLGSAGLKTEEALAAMIPTLNMIVGAEGDITESTKLVASVFNNFKDTLKETGSLQEQFKSISDTIIKTFVVHQVELNELTEGYKYLLAMGKESNLTFVEMSGILGVLNDHLIKASTAGTGMQTVLARISKDPVSFARAFDIEIDPNKPLQILNILEDIGNKMASSALTAGEVGDVFDRLGMRGAKAFTVLVRSMDEVRQAIWSIEYEGKDYAEKIAKIMIEKPDVAFKQLGQTMQAVVREGLGPLVLLMSQAAVGSVVLGEGYIKLDENIKFVLNSLLQLITLLSTVVILSKLTVFTFAKFGPASVDFKTLGDAATYVGRAFWVLGAAIGNVAMGLVTLNAARVKAAFTAFAALIPGGTAALVLMGVAAAAFIGYKLWTYFDLTSEAAAKAVGKIKELIDKHYDETKAIVDKEKRYKEALDLLSDESKNRDELIKKFPELISFRDLEGRAILKSKEELQDYVKILEEERNLKISGFIENVPTQAREVSEKAARIKRNVGAGFGTLTNMVNYPELGSEFTSGTFMDTKVTADEVKKDLKEISPAYVSMMGMVEKLKALSDLAVGSEKDMIDDFIKTLTDQMGDLKTLFVESNKMLIEMGLQPERGQSKQRAEMPERTTYSRDILQGYQQQLPSYIYAVPGMVSESEQYALEERKAANMSQAYQIKIQMAKIDKELIQNAKDYYGNDKKLMENRFAHLYATLGEEAATKKLGAEQAKFFKMYLDGVKLREVEMPKAAMAEKNSIDSLAKSYEGLGIKLRQGIHATITETISLGPFDKLVDIDEKLKIKTDQLKDEVNKFFESVGAGSIPTDRLAGLVEKLGINVDKSKLNFMGIIGQIDKVGEVQKRVFEKRAMDEYNQAVRDMLLEQTDKMAGLTFQMKEYHTVEEHITELKRQQGVELDKLANQLVTVGAKIEEYDMMASVADEKMKKYFEYQTSQLKKQQDNLKEEIELRKKLNPELERQRRLESDIADLRRKQSIQEQYGQSAMAAGQYGQAVPALEKSLETDRMAKIQEKKDQLNKVGIEGEEAQAKYIDMINQEYGRKKVQLFISNNAAILADQERSAMEQSELAFRTGEGLQGYWDGTVEAMKAATIKYYSESENMARMTADLTYSIFDRTSQAVKDLLWDMVSSGKINTEALKKIMFDFLNDLARKFSDFAAEMAKIAIFKTVASLMLSAASSSASSGYTGTAGEAGISQIGPSNYVGTSTGTVYTATQTGGYLQGGIPGKDSIPILGMPGEFMIPKDSVDYYGLELMEKLRTRELKKMQDGGLLEWETRSRKLDSYSPSELSSDKSGRTNYREGDTINHIVIQTNDVNSFREALKANKDMIAGLTYEDFDNRDVFRKHR